MYYQIYATEMLFRERQRALLEEAENRRLARLMRAARKGEQPRKDMAAQAMAVVMALFR